MGILWMLTEIVFGPKGCPMLPEKCDVCTPGSHGRLATSLGIIPSDFDAMVQKHTFPANLDMDCILATAAARQSIERCATIVASKLQEGDQRAKRAQVSECYV